MKDKNKKGLKSVLERLRNKYRLVILNDETFEEKVSLRLSRLNVFLLVSFGAIFLIFSTSILIAFTPLKEYIPGYASSEMRRNVLNLAFAADSLQRKVNLQEQNLSIIRAIINGENPDSLIAQQEINESLPDSVVFEKSVEDSLLRLAVEEEERFNLYAGNRSNTMTGLLFFSPVKGLLVTDFETEKSHFGVDVVADEKSSIKSVLDGTVILSNWTPETGYVIAIQHEQNLLSVYKHNSVLMKTVGEAVKAGEVIAIIGNTGELTTGPHLHFELWQNGVPIDPTNYILF